MLRNDRPLSAMCIIEYLIMIVTLGFIVWVIGLVIALNVAYGLFN